MNDFPHELASIAVANPALMRLRNFGIKVEQPSLLVIVNLIDIGGGRHVLAYEIQFDLDAEVCPPGFILREAKGHWLLEKNKFPHEMPGGFLDQLGQDYNELAKGLVS